MPVITVAQIKGGSTKSTTTLNLGVELSMRGFSVLLVEADPSVHTLSTWEQDREALEGVKMIPVVQKRGMLHKTLLQLAQSHDFVLVDVAGKDSQEMRTALTASDLALVPTLPSQTDVDTATLETAPVIAEAMEYNESLKVLAVMSRVPTHSFNQEAREARVLLGKTYTVAKTEVHERKVYRDSLSNGSSVVESPNAKAKAEIRGLASEVLDLINS